jgi:hypothetical protein
LADFLQNSKYQIEIGGEVSEKVIQKQTPNPEKEPIGKQERSKKWSKKGRKEKGMKNSELWLPQNYWIIANYFTSF